ncbi:hypothetical protein CKA38_00975 [Ereboglobus luteus]|uniref:DUF1570 domain-containing protein n=2 Tax=Ereboglobus luteus TaxID=1796921 RepID=A0A2U8E002_9BACT|nr:hypothetical protein CKA38_00975 [Ereboglobus luteus]
MFLVVLLLLQANVAVGAEKELKWQFVRSEHFTMLSATNKTDSRELLMRLEQLRTMFLNALLKRRAREMPCTIVMFDTRSQFEPYMPLYKGKVKPVGGFFMPGRFGSHMAMSNEHYEHAARTIIHEYLHSLVGAYAPGIPVWLNEGLAELYETFSSEGDDVEVGRAHKGHLRTLSESKWLPMEEFLKVTHGSPHYNESDKISVFYAQSWLFTHYLICGEFADKGALGRFINASLDPDIPMARAFEESFGMDYKTMERALKKYLRAGKHSVRRAKIPYAPILKKIEITPADPIDAELTTLYLKFRRHRDNGMAEQRLREILRTQPDNARAHAFLYEVLLASSMPRRSADGQAPARPTPDERRRMQEKRKLARQSLLRAVECKSDNAAVYAVLADEEFNRIDFHLGKFIKPDVSERLRGWLDHAIALDPDYLDAYNTLALVEAFSEEFREDKWPSIIEAVKARRPLGRGWIGLAAMCWRFDEKEQCAEILRRFKDAPSVDRRASRFASAMLDECEGRVRKKSAKKMSVPAKPGE